MKWTVLALVAALAGCGEGDEGDGATDGGDGSDGSDGSDGTDGADGTDGSDGSDGGDGSDGTAATGCSNGAGMARGDAFFTTDAGDSFWVLYPDPVPDCAPVVVWLHGGDNVGGYDAGRYLSPLPTGIDLLTNVFGYALLVPYLEDDRDVPHAWTGDEAPAMEAMLATLALQANIDQDEVMVMGHSAGGFMATRWALERPDRLTRAAVVGAGLCGDVTYPDAPPVPALPFQLAHDPADDVVPFSCSEALRDALDAGGHEVVLDEWEDMGHGWASGLTDSLLIPWLGEPVPPEG